MESGSEGGSRVSDHDTRPMRLPELPEGWTWHVAMAYGRFVISLVDATRPARIMFRKENPGQFDAGTPYERLLENGVHIAKIEEAKVGRALRKARDLADRAWLIAASRAALEKRVAA